MKRIIVTADDFGLTPGVVAGIIDAHENGIVNATSLMVNAPAAERAFDWARHNDSLAVGLHFVLTFGKPVGPVEPLGELVDENGRFHRLEAGAHSRATPDQVRAELRAQLDLFEAKVGRRPTHIDGHHHVHAIDGVLAAVLGEAGPNEIPVRAPNEMTRQRLLRSNVASTGFFVDAFYGEGNVGEDHLLAILETLPEGTSELMCHPATEDALLGSLSGYVQPRFKELETLTSPRVKEAVAALR